jgi:HK97 family phage major capsid protein
MSKVLAEAVAQVDALRAELDQRYGEQWPSDAVEQFERAVSELDQAMEAAQARASRLKQYEERRSQAEALTQPQPAATLTASVPARTHTVQQQEPVRSWGDAFRAWCSQGEGALTPAERQTYLAAGESGVGWRLQWTAAPPSATGEDLLVPAQLAATVRIARRRTGLMRQLCAVRRTSRDVYQEPYVAPSGEYVSGQITDTWPGNAGLDPVAARTALQQQFQRREIRVWPWEPGHVVASRATIEDAEVDLEAVLADIISRQEALAEDKAFIVGDGSQKPQGVFTDSSTPTVTAGSATNISYDDVVNLYTAVREEYAEQGVWLIHRSALAQMLRFKDSAQRPIFMPGQNVLTLFDRPIFRSGFVPAVASGQRPMLFGDLTQYYIVDRSDLLLIPLRERYAPHMGFAIWSRKGGKLMDAEAVAVLEMA